MTNTRRAVTAVCEEFALPRIEIDTAIRSEGDGIEANDGMGRRHASANKTIRLLEDDLFVTVVNAHGLRADNATLY